MTCGLCEKDTDAILAVSVNEKQSGTGKVTPRWIGLDFEYCQEHKKEALTAALSGFQSAEMRPSEALYGFAAWLTSLDEKVVFSATDDAAIAADLVSEYCAANGFLFPRDDFGDRIKQPVTRRRFWEGKRQKVIGRPKAIRDIGREVANDTKKDS